MRTGIRVIAQVMGMGLIALLKRAIIHSGSGLCVVFGVKLSPSRSANRQCGLGGASMQQG